MSITYDRPGITRDNKEVKIKYAGFNVNLIDTAGLEEVSETKLSAQMTQNSLDIIRSCDVVLFVVDHFTGVVKEDSFFMKIIRKYNKRTILLVNKSENVHDMSQLDGSFYSLGCETIIPISATHSRGLNIIESTVKSILKESYAIDKEADSDKNQKPIKISFVGRPNAGKSTIINKIFGEQRLLTSDIPGTTRDSVSVEMVYNNQKIKLIDTAGIRKKMRISDKVESMSVADSMRAIDFSEVVIIVIDAQISLDSQDMHIISMAIKEGRGIVLCINKTDLIPAEHLKKYLKQFKQNLIPGIHNLKIISISAIKSQNINHVIDAALEVSQSWNKRISTGQLNNFLQSILSDHHHPRKNGRPIKIKFMTQIKTRPPEFALFVNDLDNINEDYLSYLTNKISTKFNLDSVPLRVSLRKSKNPYSKH